MQSGLGFTNRAPRHSSRGREQNTMDLNIFQTNDSRNDFDWSEESLSPGAGWGEYVEEYEVSDTSLSNCNFDSLMVLRIILRGQ